jgi:hypothetical protein
MFPFYCEFETTFFFPIEEFTNQITMAKGNHIYRFFSSHFFLRWSNTRMEEGGNLGASLREVERRPRRR